MVTKMKTETLSEAELVKRLGEDAVGELEVAYDVDLSDGAVAITLDGAKAGASDIEAALALKAAQGDLPVLLIASGFEDEGRDKALEYEDVLLCTKSGEKVVPLIPA
jgi:hypothetical protein